MPMPLPRWNWKVPASFASFPAAAFPQFGDGRLPHSSFRGLLSIHSRFGLQLRQVAYATLAPETQAASSPPPPLQLLPAGTTPAGRDLHPLNIKHLSKAYPNCQGAGTIETQTRDLTRPGRVHIFVYICGRPVNSYDGSSEAVADGRSHRFPVFSQQDSKPEPFFAKKPRTTATGGQRRPRRAVVLLRLPAKSFPTKF